MTRFGMVVAAGFLCVGLLGGDLMRTGTLAQDDAGDLRNHPLVGSWVVNDDSGIWPTAYSLVTFHGDGTLVATDAFGHTWQGSWTATGERTAEYAFVSLGNDGTARGAVKFFAQAEVDASGATWSQDFDLQNGGDFGGVRITAEPSFQEAPPLALTPIGSSPAAESTPEREWSRIDLVKLSRCRLLEPQLQRNGTLKNIPGTGS